MSQFGQNILICDPDPASRMRFKQVALGSCKFNDIHIARDIDSALEQLDSSKSFSYQSVISSFRFSNEELTYFSNQLQSRKNKFDGAFLLVIPSLTKTSDVYDHFFTGTDGFLLEPFGVEDMESVLSISLKVKAKNNEQRKQVFEVLLDESLIQIDELARTKLKAPGSQGRLELLKSIKGMTIQVSEANIEAFQKIALEKIIAQEEAPSAFGDKKSDKLEALNERSQTITAEHNKFDKDLSESVSGIFKKLSITPEDKKLVYEGITRIKKLVESYGIEVELQEVLPRISEQNGESAALARLRAKLEQQGVDFDL